MRKNLGFTLIELLVVVAIITLLIALMMPNLSKAKDRAKTVTCQSNLKQIGMAIYTYEGNHSDKVMSGCYAYLQYHPQTGAIRGHTIGDGGNAQASWNEVLVADGVVKQRFTVGTGGWTSGQLWAAGRGIFYCPSSALQPQGGRGDLGYGIGYYAASRFYDSGGAILQTGLPPDQKGASTMKTQWWNMGHIVAFDGGVYSHRSGMQPFEGVVYNNKHNKGANYLMGDGHAEWSDKYHLERVNQDGEKDFCTWSHAPMGVKGGRGGI